MPTSDTRSAQACSSRINSAVAGNAEANVPPAFEQMCSFEQANADSCALSPQHAHEVLDAAGHLPSACDNPSYRPGPEMQIGTEEKKSRKRAYCSARNSRSLLAGRVANCQHSALTVFLDRKSVV